MQIPSVTSLIVISPVNLHREAWRALLTNQPALQVIAVGADPSVLNSLRQHRPPTTILIDQTIPDPNFARQIRATAPDDGVLFFVSDYNLSEIVALLQAGATGCIGRDETVAALARAVIAAGRGELVLPSQVALDVLKILARGKDSSPSPSEALSERETEVLRLLSRGYTNKDVAQALILSVRTVEAHLRRVYAKLDVSSRTEAVLWAVRHGFAADDDR